DLAERAGRGLDKRVVAEYHNAGLVALVFQRERLIDRRERLFNVAVANAFRLINREDDGECVALPLDAEAGQCEHQQQDYDAPRGDRNPPSRRRQEHEASPLEPPCRGNQREQKQPERVRKAYGPAVEHLYLITIGVNNKVSQRNCWVTASG